MAATLTFQPGAQPPRVVKLDTLSRILAELCKPGGHRARDGRGGPRAGRTKGGRGTDGPLDKLPGELLLALAAQNSCPPALLRVWVLSQMCVRCRPAGEAPTTRPTPGCPAGAYERREEHVLRDFVDAESRNYSGERFNRFVAELHSRIKSLIQRCGGQGWRRG